ncbi:MAG: Crp/Fnr family transcriptional regulator [Sulfurospirillum sp.]|nr:Crp/Fnr family transcriptional regulator [Sulfurospirillum sp.]
METREIKKYLQEIPLFQGLDAIILEQLCKAVKIKQFSAMDILFYEKEDKEEIYYITSGSLKFYKVDRFENEIFLYKLSKNSLIFSASKLCDNFIISCYANAEFLEDSEVLIFDSQTFKQLMRTQPSFMHTILKEAFGMIQRLQCIISRDVVFDGTAKVAHMLIHELDNFNAMKKHEIAYMLHIQPETLSRILKKLTRNAIINTIENNIVILDELSLREIYE